MGERIEVRRKEGEDAIRVAAEAARKAGVRLQGNLRWYGAMGPAFREIGTTDGRTIRVLEPIQ